MQKPQNESLTALYTLLSEQQSWINGFLTQKCHESGVEILTDSPLVLWRWDESVLLHKGSLLGHLEWPSKQRYRHQKVSSRYRSLQVIFEPSQIVSHESQIIFWSTDCQKVDLSRISANLILRVGLDIVKEGNVDAVRSKQVLSIDEQVLIPELSFILDPHPEPGSTPPQAPSNEVDNASSFRLKIRLCSSLWQNQRACCKTNRMPQGFLYWEVGRTSLGLQVYTRARSMQPIMI